jgi:7,8-dihydropterin-6-yl-methyl-4-(beta-D-ribofuranosyl)aminobenzene 5'-phosphate synthase
MSLKDAGYAIYWAAAGVTKPRMTSAFVQDRRRIDDEWQAERAREAAHPHHLAGLGTARALSIMPLVEHFTTDDRLTGEPGVSYLVTVDGWRILFDVGYNIRREHPSPLLRNMTALGLSPDDIDAVFISHCHLDHVGGAEEMRQRTFSLSADPVDLGGTPAYVPTAMTHPSCAVEVVAGPRKLVEGVASTGPLARAIWLMGTVTEQSLLVDVERRGVIIIVGCGHPSLSRLIARAQTITDRPLYGVVGGLHFPVGGSRVGKGGQNILGNGKLPWQRITRDEVRDAAALLAECDMRLIALSGHDSTDWSLETLQTALGGRYRTLRVGEEIVVA